MFVNNYKMGVYNIKNVESKNIWYKIILVMMCADSFKMVDWRSIEDIYMILQEVG